MALRVPTMIDGTLARRGYRLDHTRFGYHCLFRLDDDEVCMGVASTPYQALVSLEAAGWPSRRPTYWGCPVCEA